ncbi:MAG TPA: protein-glutamate O-methyltransferase CheR [Longimicrobiales bacterium]|nr:protein-glutamate O-methyltransferase CheR [Longimicrobiales bacterium]
MPGDGAPSGTPAPLPLSTGELGARDAAELQDLLNGIRDRFGLSGAAYKERYFRRRLGLRMRRLGIGRYADYARRLEDDPEEYGRLLDAVAINVSRFFRNPDVWQALRRDVVPALFARDGAVRLWSAGAAAGEEAYTLAMVLAEHAGGADDLERFAIVGTDIDTQALERARRAEYPDDALAELDPGTRVRWFDGGPPWRVRPELLRLVRFRTLDLAGDRFPGDQHLILCRNVLIYFERALQEAVLARFVDALAPGGYLVLGQAETLVGPARETLRRIGNRERVYQRA